MGKTAKSKVVDCFCRGRIAIYSYEDRPFCSVAKIACYQYFFLSRVQSLFCSSTISCLCDYVVISRTNSQYKNHFASKKTRIESILSYFIPPVFTVNTIAGIDLLNNRPPMNHKIEVTVHRGGVWDGITGYQYQNSSKNLVNIENPVILSKDFPCG